MDASHAGRAPQFPHGEFLGELRRRVDAWFEANGTPRRDAPSFYAKAALLLGTYALLYVALVFFARTWWQALPLAVLLGFTMALIGMNVQHDGGHGAVSDRAGRNRWAARTLELVGGSSYFWHWKHGVLHHTWTNVDRHDTDMDVGALGRLTPHQPRHWFHRWQQYYLWPLYGLLVIKWHLFDDFREVVVGRMGSHRVPRPRGAEAILFVLGKVLFLGLAFAVPLQFHAWPAVLACYVVAAGVAGIVLSVVFQLAHVVEDAAFPLPVAGTGRLPDEWAVHQVRTTVDFARSSRVTTWLLGGLNFQVEHHLFPRICHVHYPRISPLVEATCREFGVPFHAHASFGAGVASHFRWLKRMGAPEPSRAPAA